jgi:hypothetical protein
MNKRWILLLISCLLIPFALKAQTYILPGDVQGTWDAPGSPYYIVGEIVLPEGDSLVIEPGVDVIFMWHDKFEVRGHLEAIGTETDSILFTASSPGTGWHGIRFFDDLSRSRLSYCTLTHGLASGTSGGSGGALYTYDSNPIIDHCKIVDNFSYGNGGGIACQGSIGPTIRYCEIRDNEANAVG